MNVAFKDYTVFYAFKIYSENQPGWHLSKTEHVCTHEL